MFDLTTSKQTDTGLGSSIIATTRAGSQHRTWSFSCRDRKLAEASICNLWAKKQAKSSLFVSSCRVQAAVTKSFSLLTQQPNGRVERSHLLSYQWHLKQLQTLPTWSKTILSQPKTLSSDILNHVGPAQSTVELMLTPLFRHIPHVHDSKLIKTMQHGPDFISYFEMFKLTLSNKRLIGNHLNR